MSRKRKYVYVGYYWSGSSWVSFYSGRTRKDVELMCLMRFGKDYRENPSAFKIEKEKVFLWI